MNLAQIRSRRRALLVVAALSIAVAGTGAWVVARHRADPFAMFHQARLQTIPGTFGYVLTPADGMPRVEPEAAYRALLGSERGLDVSLTYAVVRNDRDGIEWGPAWVYLTHDLCYFTAKGDFVSPSRAGEEDGCTPDNILVQVVDAQTGEFVAAFDAFDVDGGWLPERTGDPQASPTTRFH
ncbi:MAG: hypothetical protein ABI572_03010 [Actinomycetota bacterium]